MSALDIAVYLILGFFCIAGILRGFIRDLSSIVALFGALIVSKRYSYLASRLISLLKISDPSGTLAYVVVFIGTYVLIKLIAFALQRISKASGLSPLDRILGGLFGILKGAIIACIGITLLQMGLPKGSAILKHSHTRHYSNKIISHTKSIVPTNFYKRIKKITDEIN